MPDTLEIPILHKPYGRYLSACGHLTAADAKVRARLARLHRAPVIARVGSGEGAEYVELLGGGGKDASDRHIHIDVSAKSHLVSVPKKTVDVDRVSELVSPFFGQAVQVRVMARFEVPWRKLPADGIVRKTLKQTKSSSALRQTAAVYRVGNGASETTLSFLRRGKVARVQIEFGIQTEISPTYLQELNDLAFAGVSLFILDEDPDAAKPPVASRK
jgi:hypothetical protein